MLLGLTALAVAGCGTKARSAEPSARKAPVISRSCRSYGNQRRPLSCISKMGFACSSYAEAKPSDCHSPAQNAASDARQRRAARIARLTAKVNAETARIEAEDAEERELQPDAVQRFAALTAAPWFLHTAQDFSDSASCQTLIAGEKLECAVFHGSREFSVVYLCSKATFEHPPPPIDRWSTAGGLAPYCLMRRV